MKEIRLKAYAKINLGLDVVGKTEDGYHDVRMVMQTVDLYDEINLGISEGEGKISMRIEADDEASDNGPDISAIPVDERNLCVKAAKAFLEALDITGEDIEIGLKKRIPSEAGMAGGSTDAAAVLVGLNELFETKKTKEELAIIGLSLGADIPYCIYGGSRLAEGIGEIFTEIEPALEEIPIVLVKPPFGVSTADIYNAIDYAKEVIHPDIDAIVADISSAEYEKLSTHIGNSMEAVVCEKHPEILEIKQQLLDMGAYAACMSGSGTTVYGLFEDERVADAARSIIKKRNEKYYCRLTKTINKGVSYD